MQANLTKWFWWNEFWQLISLTDFTLNGKCYQLSEKVHHNSRISEMYYAVHNNLLIEWFYYFIGMMILLKDQNRSDYQSQNSTIPMVPTTLRNSSTCLGPIFVLVLGQYLQLGLVFNAERWKSVKYESYAG